MLDERDDAHPDSAAAAELAAPAPVTRLERIAAIDVLRGVAVFGILVMNIKAFAMIGAAYANPNVHGELEGLNRWVWLIEHHLFDMKMMSIFSMLYGAGVVLLTERLEARTGNSAGVHYRRTGWLILMGLIHAHLIWHGDILFLYGMCGLVLYPMRRLPPGLLALIGVVLMMITSSLTLAGWLAREHFPPENLEAMREFWSPSPEAMDAEIAAFRGDWGGELRYRSGLATTFEVQMLFFFGWKILGNMLLGMALFKLGALSAAWPKRTYMAMVAGGAVVGLPLIAMGVRANDAAGWTMVEGMFRNAQFNYWGSLFVAFAWIGLVMLVVQSGALGWLMSRLAAVGQMALTNYLMHSVICTTIFYGHGFGRFETMPDRWQQELVVLAICVFQLLASKWWLGLYRFGPVEWLWRSLTYWKPQPMRREVALRA